MRIAIVNGSIRHGGAEHFTVTMANTWIKEFPEEVYLITGKEKEGEYSLESGVHRVCALREGNSLSGLLQNAKTVSKLSNENNIDVVIGIGIYANICVCLSKIATKAKIIISERNDPKHDSISWKSKFLRWLLFRRADGVVFQTKGAQNFYSKKIQKKSVVIHNPIVENLPYRTGDGNKELVAVGRLESQKNYPNLLRAFSSVHAKYPEYVLRIFGQGSKERELKQLAIDLGIINAVKFEGFCLNVHDQIRNSDIYIMASDFEGMPNSLMEAMAMGFPVITTDCPSGGPKELIQNGVNGLLVPIKNSKCLADQIIYLIENPKIKKRLAKNALTIRESHSSEMILNQWMNFMRGNNNE